MLHVGFTIIEFISYIACATILSLGIFMWVEQVSSDVIKLRKKMQRHFRVQLIRNIVLNDLDGASSSLGNYDKTKHAFKKQWLDERGRQCDAWIAYESTKNGLARIQGIYDLRSGVWGKRFVSYLPPCFESVKIEPISKNNDENVSSVRIFYFINKEVIEMTDECVIKNRIIK